MEISIRHSPKSCAGKNPYLCRKLHEALPRQWLRQNVCKLKLGCAVVQINVFLLNYLPDEVEADIDVFAPSVMNWILREGDSRCVITIDLCDVPNLFVFYYLLYPL